MAHANDQYTEDERKATLELAANTSIKGAERALGVNRTTIYRWIRQDPTYWSELQVDPTRGKRKVAEQLDVLVQRYTDVEHELLEQVEGGAIQVENAKDAASMMKAFAAGRQTAVAGSRQISGEPEVHEHNVNFPQIEQMMAQMLEQAGRRGDLPPHSRVPPLELDEAGRSADDVG